jgi:hypothetical protein
MLTQQDTNVRVVALENLKAMCNHVSRMCHRFTITKVTDSRVHVQYSNPNEYGSEFPMTAVFPCYSLGAEKENPSVVLDILRVNHDSWDGEGWQAFDILLDCPRMWRNPENIWTAEKE